MKDEVKVIEGRKLLAIVMTLALLFSMLPVGGAKATGSEPTKDPQYYSVGSDTTYPDGWYTISGSDPVLLWGNGNGFWYRLTNDSISGKVTVSGKVNLMLTNGTGASFNGGLEILEGGELNIYSGTREISKRNESVGNALGIYVDNADTVNTAVSGKGTLNVKSGIVTIGNSKSIESAYAIASDTTVTATNAEYYAGTDANNMKKVTGISKNQKFVRIAAKGSSNSGYVPTVTAAPAETPEPSTEVKIETTVENGNAKVSEITAETIAASASASSQTSTEPIKVLTITAAKAGETVTSVELSKTSVKALEEALESKSTTYEKVVIEMTDVSVEVDAGTLAALTSQAKDGETIKLEVNDTPQTSLKAEQQNALTQWTQAAAGTTREVAKVIKASFVSGGSEIHAFNGGKVTLSVKFQPAAGKDANHYHVYYVAENGTMTRQATSYKNGKILFETDHFSEYAIVYDSALENETGKATPAPTATPTAAPVATATPAPTAPAETAAPVDTATPAPTTAPTATPAAVKKVSANVSLVSGLKVTQSGKKLTCKWGKVSDATKYIVSAQYTDNKKSLTKATVKKSKTSYTFTKLAKKALNAKKIYKVTVTAYKSSKKLGAVTAYAAGSKNAKYASAKKLTVKKASVSIKKGKTATINATVTLTNAKKKVVTGVKKLRYVSSDTTIATVNASGKITAKKKAGTCTIYVYAANGYTQKVKVTVK